ncbi:MAG TPA: alpha/beta fold hydrolase [Bacteroidota bacterium]|nr:alpha/beta fold hydrolase [Bacteroidota bacterium]
MKLFFQEYGSGPALVILHGLLGTLDNWHTLSRRFASSYRVLAADLRNHGRSPHSDHLSYNEMAEDVLELLDDQHVSTSFVLGHSMGGKVAMTLALQHPDRVGKLIVVDIAPRSYKPLHDELVHALMSVDLSRYTSRQDIDETLSQSIPDRAVRQFLMKNLARDPSGSFIWKANLSTIARRDAEISVDITADTPFPKPTLFVRGNRSDYITETDTPLIHRMFPSARIETIEAGHWVHAEAPAQFAEVVERFLSGSVQ